MIGAGSGKSAAEAGPGTGTPPRHDVRDLTDGTGEAQIVLDDKVYTLRITRQRKLILTR